MEDSGTAPASETQDGPALDIGEILAGRRVLFVGATGFVGKVALSMLLCRYPGIGRVHVLVRPGSGLSAEQRFFQKIALSRPFAPIHEAFGDAALPFLREKVRPVPGDVSQPMLGIPEANLGEILGAGVDVLINCAGLVSFNPSLESALRINVSGVRNAIAFCRKAGCALVHVSTCFVAGNRDGEVWEDEPLIGYFPRRPGLSPRRDGRPDLRDDDFSALAEVADCERLLAQTRARADDRAHVSMFRDRGAQRLIKEGRDPDDERHLKAAVQRERKLWLSERLTELGMERAQHWGWPNTYTYTKSLGDQLCALAAHPGPDGDPVRVAIVRPAIVESAVSYPFPGWNEGFNTTAPLVFMVLRGHQQVPSGKDVILDLIPVDMVASGLIAVTAATLAGRHRLVYHLGSSDSNPFRMERSIELTGLYKRRHFRALREEGALNRLRARMESFPVTRERFQRTSIPLWRELAGRLSHAIEEQIPSWGMPRVTALLEHSKQRLDDVVELATQAESVFKLFMPFIYDNAVVFRCDHIRELFRGLSPADRAALRWEPERIEWRSYFLEVHLPGLEKWIFPSLDEEFRARPRTVYAYRDLNELISAATKHYRGRTAMRLLPPPGPDGLPQGEGKRYTYRDIMDRATRAAHALLECGVTAGGKVMLVSENRPEWGITYFGILKAGGACVPVDAQATFDEIANIARAARPQAIVASDRVAARIDIERALAQAGVAARALSFSDLEAPLSNEERLAMETTLARRPESGRGDEVASLIFTSGTTGRPKGVMLSHRNFTSLLAKLGAVFDLDKHDGLLSVLPLHHTFEFSAGLLMPLMRGAQISYLAEVNQDTLSSALRSAHVTGMVGVPALWQLFYRRITRQITDMRLLHSPWVLRIFELLLDGLHRLRQRTQKTLGFDPNLPRLLFLPVHRRFGGRLRLLISGGSALPQDTMKSLRGLGFNLYEGYGLTEAAPVLTVTRPGQPLALGSVGEALPGIDVKLHEPDDKGVGEVIASGPNIMLGYYEDEAATSEVLRDGYLHTGDLGRFDEERRLYIVGRKKDVIIGASGENVYPDELEEVYQDSPYIKELSIVGLKNEDGKDELVACLLVPDYEGQRDLPRDEVRERVREHVRTVSARLPPHKRIKVLHLTDIDLPRTVTRKVRRNLVAEELRKLERVQRQAASFRSGTPSRDGAGAGKDAWILDVLAEVTSKPRERIRPESSMQELGLDSLTYAELAVALEAAGVAVPDNVDMSAVTTVEELAALVGRWGKSTRAPNKDRRRKEARDDDVLDLPEPLIKWGSEALNFGQRLLYERVLRTSVHGAAHLPANSRFIVAANHASHLDMGLVKYALGDWGRLLMALAAKDYFFEDPLRRAYFENFTSLIPMDRHGPVRESLRLAAEVIKSGHVLLIFPEGTRSETGVMREFKPSIGYLALHNQIDVLPMYLAGTHDAMPKGQLLPTPRHRIAAHIGPLIAWKELRQAVGRLPKSEQNREAARIVERAVRRLAPDGNRQMPGGAEGAP